MAVGVPGQFSYQDGIPDSIQTLSVRKELYSEEVAVEVSKCFEEDTQDLKAFGDYLAICRAPANNKDASPSDRVIEEGTKKLINTILVVSL